MFSKHPSIVTIDPTKLIQDHEHDHQMVENHHHGILLGHFLWRHHHNARVKDYFSAGTPHALPDFPTKSQEHLNLGMLGYSNDASIELTNDIVYAQNKWGEDEWHVFEKNDASSVKIGCYGQVRKVGVLRLKHDHSVKFIPKNKVDHELCVKIQNRGTDKNPKTGKYEPESVTNFNYRVTNEADLLKRDLNNYSYPPVFFMKPQGQLSVESSAIAMRLHTGEDLYHLWFQLIQGKLKLCVRQFIKICIAIARDLQRLHQLNIIHRDLKSNNVMVDLRRLRAKIIDAGQAIDANADDDFRRGNSNYSPPERFQGKKLDAKSDSYNLAWMLHIFLGGSWNIIADVDKLPELFAKQALNFADYDPFTLVPELSSSARRLFIEAFNKLTEREIEQRISETEALPYFEEALLQHDCDELVTIAPEAVPAYRRGFELGITLRNAIFNLSGQGMHRFEEHAETLKSLLLESIKQLPKNAYAIGGFVEQSECQLFQGAKTKAELRNKVEKVFSNYILHFSQLNALFLKLQVMVNSPELEMPERIRLSKFIRRTNLLAKREMQLPLTPDNLFLMQKKYEKYLNKYRNKLIEFSIALPSRTHYSPGLFHWHDVYHQENAHALLRFSR